MSLTPNIALFKKHLPEEHVQALANLLPSGRAFENKNVSTSNLRRFVSTMAPSFDTLEQVLIDTTRDYNLCFTELLLDEWESALGIPDSCFPGTGTIEERRAHVLLKFAGMNPLTEQDFIDIALALGFVVTIEHPSEGAFLPYFVSAAPITSGTPGSFPAGGDIFFRWTVIGVGVASTGFMPYIVTTVPTAEGVTPPSFPRSPGSNILQCVFNLLKPSMTIISFENP